MGRLGKVHADNAREFRGHMIRRACDEYGIGLEWRPVKTEIIDWIISIQQLILVAFAVVDALHLARETWHIKAI